MNGVDHPAVEQEPLPPFQCSRSIAKIAEALAKAQGKLQNPTRDKTASVTSKRTGAQYSYNYADLATVLAGVRPVLSEFGIALVQPPVMAGANRLEVVTTLIHISGEWIASSLGIELDDKTPQAVGGAITYLRRYQVQSLVGVASEEDDDASTTDVRMSGRGSNGRHDDRRQQHRQENAASTARVAEQLREQKREAASEGDAGQPQPPAEPTIPSDGIYTPARIVHLDKDAAGNPVKFGVLTTELGDWILETADKEIARAALNAKKEQRRIVIDWKTVNGHRVIEQIGPAPAGNGAAA
jgi:hypothetical protein